MKDKKMKKAYKELKKMKGWYTLEIRSTEHYSHDIAQQLENKLENNFCEITHYKGCEEYYGRSVHNSPMVAAMYMFRLTDNVDKETIAKIGGSIGLTEVYSAELKYTDLGGTELIWSSEYE